MIRPIGVIKSVVPSRIAKMAAPMKKAGRPVVQTGKPLQKAPNQFVAEKPLTELPQSKKVATNANRAQTKSCDIEFDISTPYDGCVC